MIETERLLLVPLSARQLALWVSDLPSLERELDCAYRGEAIEGTFGKIVQGQIPRMERDPGNTVFLTFHLMIRKAGRAAIGSISYKNPPDERREVEIGYGVAKEFEGRGYTTEAAKAMCGWALARPDIDSVVAETLRTNAASERVLEKCGMTKTHTAGEYHYWVLRKERRNTGSPEI